MKRIFSLLLLLALSLIIFAQIKDKAHYPPAASVIVDGIISPAEWGKQANVKRFSFDLGDCFYKIQHDTLFFAFQITTDTYDDQQADQLILYADANKNNIIDDNDIIKCTYASYFGKSEFLNYYAYRSWEFAVPLTNLFKQDKAGFAFRVISKIPRIDRIVEYSNSYGLELVIENSRAIISAAVKNDQAVAVADTSIKVIGQKILENGNYEISYSDGSKKLLYKGGYTTIFPDGRKSSASYMSVSPFVPPYAPNDPDMVQYLQNLSNTLLSLLSDLLNNDKESIANFQKGDAGLTIYKIINRRFEFINYITRKK